MKKLCYSAFIAFWSCVATLLALQLLTAEGQGSRTHRQIQPTSYTLEEVAQHARISDCWMAMEGKVYDLTDYVISHPTPAEILEPYCGTEATEGMRTKGYGRDHSPAAYAMLANYEIGTLDQH